MCLITIETEKVLSSDLSTSCVESVTLISDRKCGERLDRGIRNEVGRLDFKKGSNEFGNISRGIFVFKTRSELK